MSDQLIPFEIRGLITNLYQDAIELCNNRIDYNDWTIGIKYQYYFIILLGESRVYAKISVSDVMPIMIKIMFYDSDNIILCNSSGEEYIFYVNDINEMFTKLDEYKDFFINIYPSEI
jgi:hypothetical protein